MKKTFWRKSVAFFLILPTVAIITACGSSGDEESSAAPPPAPAENPAEGSNPPEKKEATLSFDLAGAAGIVKVGGSGASAMTIRSLPSGAAKSLTMGQPYKKITAKGEIADFISGPCPIHELFLSPTGKIYLLLSSKLTYTDDQGKTIGCSLLKVGMDNSFECVDGEMSSAKAACYLEFCTPAVQFDGEGSIYYSGRMPDGSLAVRKKSLDGTVADLITDRMDLTGFLVAEDGTVYLTGSSAGTDLDWLRRLDRNGSLRTLEGHSSSWMAFFPDGDIYLLGDFVDAPSYRGVFAIEAETGEIRKRCWINLGDEHYDAANNKCSSENIAGFELADYQAQDLCAAAGLEMDCLGIMRLSDFLPTPGGAIYAAVGSPTRRLWRLFPDVAPISVAAIENVTVAVGLYGQLAVAGQDQRFAHKFVLYDVASGGEIDLLPENEVEVYHARLADDGKIWFDGHRFDDNQYVIGVIDTAAGRKVTYLATTNVRLQELQLL